MTPVDINFEKKLCYIQNSFTGFEFSIFTTFDKKDVFLFEWYEKVYRFYV